MSKARFIGVRRTGALCTVLALTMGVVIALAAPASAVPPLGASNFHPQTSVLNTDGTHPNTLLLSDKFDGAEDDPATTDVDESRTAHLTVTATPDTTQVLWYVCPPGTYTLPILAPPTGQNAGAAPNAVAVAFPPAATCLKIGEDLTPNLAVPPIFPGQNVGVDEAYELFWDIPSTFDEVARDVVSFACVFGPNASSCTGEAERALIDDAASPAFDSSSGELRWWCVDAVPLAPLPADPTDCNTQIHSLRHGSTVPASFGQYAGGRLVVNARVSQDVDLATLCVDFTADALQDPNACDFSDSVTTQAAAAYADAFFDALLAVFPIGAEMSFFLYERDITAANESDNEAGFCDLATLRPQEYTHPPGGVRPSCVLDNHYVVSSTPFPAQVHATNDDVDPDSDDVNETVLGDQTGAVGPTGADLLCEAANRRVTDTVPAGHFDNVIGCVFDQFADDDFPFPLADNNKDPFGLIANETVSFEISNNTTNAIWRFCEGGVISADGLRCTTANANFSLADRKYEADWRATTTGTLTITVCVDPEGVFGDGCANATVKDTLTKTVVPGPPQHVHLRLHEEAIVSDTCHPGTASLTANVNTRVDLQGCLFDAFHNGINDERVIWRLETQGFFPPGGDDPARFINVPEQTTHVDNGHDGRANATVTAGGGASGHLTNVFFCLDSNLNGECDDFQGNTLEALFQISWKGPACIRGTSGGDTLRGTAGPDCIRGLGGNDRIFGGRGADTLYGGFGDDVIHAGPGKDTVIGGPGVDVCWVRGGVDIDVGCEIIKHGA